MEESKNKAPWCSVFLSYLVPGLGQIYSRKKRRGFLWLFWILLYWVMMCLYAHKIIFSELAITLSIVMQTGCIISIFLSFNLIMLFDSYKCAKRLNINIISKRKNGWKAMILSAILPGLGQIYNKQVIKGIGFFILFIGSYQLLEKRYSLFTLILITSIGGTLWVAMLLDAWKAVERKTDTYKKLQNELNTIYLILIFMSIVIRAIPIDDIYKRHFVAASKTLSNSMSPTIVKTDRVLINKYIYTKKIPERGDIISFKYPENPEKHFFKRIVGLPGEIIEIKNGNICINGKVVNTLKIPAEREYYNEGVYGQKGNSVTIPADNYYVLGDYSANSRDSRYFGFVPQEYIIGKVYKIYYPFNRSRGL